jgi:hypothetical protein
VCREQSGSTRYAPFLVKENLGSWSLETFAHRPIEIKLVVAATYTNFSTTIIDDDGIETIDAYAAKPRSNKLILRFESIWDSMSSTLLSTVDNQNRHSIFPQQ